jgi:hypothetical protein
MRIRRLRAGGEESIMSSFKIFSSQQNKLNIHPVPHSITLVRFIACRPLRLSFEMAFQRT